MKNIIILSMILTLFISNAHAGKISLISKVLGGGTAKRATVTAFKQRSKTVMISTSDVAKIGQLTRNHFNKKSKARVNRLIKSWGVD